MAFVAMKSSPRGTPLSRSARPMSASQGGEAGGTAMRVHLHRNERTNSHKLAVLKTL